MVSSVLLLIALVSNLYQRIAYRVIICLVVIFTTGIHTYFFSSDVSFSYYGTAAIANLCVILFLSMISRSPLATSVQIINLAGIASNFLGYVMYEAGITPVFYNSAMLLLVAIEFLRLIVRTENDRDHDMCAADRMHFGLSSDDSISGSVNKSECK